MLAAACTDDESAPLSVRFGESSFSALPGEAVSVPFTVTGGSGVYTVDASCDRDDCEATAALNGSRGTLVFTGPAVTVGAFGTEVVVTASDSGGESASARADVSVGESASVRVRFEQESYEFSAAPGDEFTVCYIVEGDDTGFSPVSVEASGGWEAEAGYGGRVTLTASESVENEGSVKIVLADVYGRSVSAVAGLDVRRVVIPEGTANCYVVAPGTSVRFPVTHRGNSHDPADEIWPASASLVWQDSPALIAEVDFDREAGTVTVATCEDEGNALVAALDFEGNILWSWHLWVADYDPETGTMSVRNDLSYLMSWTYMDRNLGALGDSWKDMAFHGLFYQWGRKDPFPGLADWQGNEKVFYGMDGTPVEMTVAEVTVENNLDNSVRNPFTYYCQNNSMGDWYTTLLPSHDNDLWGGSPDGAHAKTVYDPCPYGWRVPENDYLTENIYPANKGYCGYFIQNGGTDCYTYEDEFFVAVYSQGGGRWYFPYSGYRTHNTGEFYSAGETGMLWTANPYKVLTNYGAYHITYSSFVGPKCNGYTQRARGMNVRCVKDTQA